MVSWQQIPLYELHMYGCAGAYFQHLPTSSSGADILELAILPKLGAVLKYGLLRVSDKPEEWG